MNFTITFDREEDGRWIAEIAEIPRALAYGSSREEAKAYVEAIALRVIAEQIESGGAGADRIVFAVS